MCRRPLLSLLALTALLALPPPSEALSCYQCSDKTGPTGDEGGQTPFHPPPCSEFDEDDNRYQQKQCAGPNDRTCSKIVFGNGDVVRGCFKEKPAGCSTNNGRTECFCTGDFCNSAGLTAPALLLLLPAALLAAFHSA